MKRQLKAHAMLKNHTIENNSSGLNPREVAGVAATASASRFTNRKTSVISEHHLPKVNLPPVGEDGDTRGPVASNSTINLRKSQGGLVKVRNRFEDSKKIFSKEM